MQPAETDASSGPGLEHLVPVMGDVVRDTGASVGLVYLLEPDEHMLRLALVSGASQRITAPWSRIPLDTSIPVADAMRSGQLVWLGSQEEIARRYPRLGIVLPYDFMLGAAPVVGGGHVWGGIVLLWPIWHPPRLSTHEREAVDGFCRRAGDILRHAADSGHRLLPEGEPRIVTPPRPQETDPAQAMAAHRFAERLPVGCCALDLDGRITFINQAGAELVGAGAASLLGKRPWEILLWLQDPVFEERYRAAVLSRQPTSFVAVRSPGTRLAFELYPDETGLSVHIKPAAEDGAVPAAQQPAYPAEAVNVMALYQLTHLAAALAEAVSVQDVVDLAADQIVPALGPQGLVLMTVDDGRLRVVGHRGYSDEFLERVDGTPVTSDVAGVHVGTTGAAEFFPSFDDFRLAHPHTSRYRNRSAWAFLPLTASGRPVGSLALSYDRPRPFPPAERALLTSLAGLIAQALDRARLYDAKHTLAHTLQTGLLPHTLPHVAGLDVAARYRPAGHGTDIGGDFYDLIRCTATTVVAAIGDVQGHNTTAAALMGQVRTAVHAHATAGASPGDILTRTNRLLTDLDPGLFTSCLIAKLDLARHRAHLATGGHPPPLLRHPDRRTEVLDVPPGLLLGIDENAEYSTTEIALPPGAVLALYTDGLVEVPGADITDTTDGLARRLADCEDPHLDDITDCLVHHADGSAARTDDVALIVVRPHL
ncbi:SpoIIE family protein phosphatase [Streptomyces sp. NPDC006540]|uniref:SpoIIE family protein phosphatase n=1 Tax=Streptomyces sp. NPDC006540 TaxID=3155353 RepID=UPI0033B3F0DC